MAGCPDNITDFYASNDYILVPEDFSIQTCSNATANSTEIVRHDELFVTIVVGIILGFVILVTVVGK